MELRQRIIHCALVDLGEISDSTADADDRQRLAGKPLDFGKHILDEALYGFDLILIHLAGGLKHLRQRHCTDRDADRMDAFFVFDEGDLYARPAQIEEEEILLIDGMADTRKAKRSLGLATDDRHGDAGRHADALQERSPVDGISDGCRRDSEYLFDLLHFDDMGVDGKTVEGPLLRFLCQKARGERHPLRQADRFLFLIDQFISAVLSDLHDDEADGVRA